MSEYKSSHTGAEIDAAVSSVLEGGSMAASVASLESDFATLDALSKSGYRIAGFIGPDNSYLAKAVEWTAYFATNPTAASWYDNVAGRVYLPPTSWTPSGDTRPGNVTGWTKVELSSQDYAGFAILFGFRNGSWVVHRLPYALQTTMESAQTSIAAANTSINATNARLGYYTCSTGGGTAAKVVTASGYTLPSNGGHVKIKMNSKNTAANATLNINSTGAKPLFYCGVRAGADNTWDDGEVIEVFYDGTNYQAAPFAGGGGSGVMVLNWTNNVSGTRNSIPNAQRVKGMMVTYQNPNILDDGGWVIEQLVGDPISNTLFGNDERWQTIPYKTYTEVNTTNGITRSSYVVSEQGTYDYSTSTITWAAGVSPTTDGFVFRTGEFDPELSRRMWKLYQMGIKPNIRILVELTNISYNVSFYGYNATGDLETNYGLQVKNEYDKVALYKNNFDITANTRFFIINVRGRNPVDSSAPSSLRLISADIYYDNPIWNTYLKEGREYSPVQRRIKFDMSMAGDKYAKAIDEETALLTIPAGTSLSARAISIPLHSFAIPLEMSTGVGKYSIVLEYEGDTPDLNFWEISSNPAGSLINLTAAQGTYDIPNAIVFTATLNASTMANYNNGYGYENVALRIGNNPTAATAHDIVTKIKVSYVGWTADENFMRDILKLKTQVYDIRKAIGNYTSEFAKPYVGICGKSAGVNLMGDNAITIPSGTAMSGQYVDLLISVGRLRELGLTSPNFEVKCMTNYTTSEAIPITAALLCLDSDLQVQTATVNYDEVYNGFVRIQFKLLKQTAGVEYLKLRLSFSSSTTTGLTLSVVDSFVAGISKRDDVRKEIDALKSPDRKVFVTSTGGKRFRLVVDDNGNLSTAPAVPSRMMVLAHSWGYIPPNKGWHGDWGLCASAEHLDMVHMIQTFGQTMNPSFTSFFQWFADFAVHFRSPEYWETHYVMEDIDFDSIAICSFAASPTDNNWTGFGQALYNCITNYVCRGKSNVPVYILHGFGDDAEMTIAANLFGTQLVNCKTIMADRNATGWPWLMPPDPVTGVRPIKRMTLPSGADENLYMLNGPLTHPGNWGFYQMTKILSNNMHIDFGVENPDPTVLNFSQYASQPDIRPYVDSRYDPNTKTYDES